MRKAAFCICKNSQVSCAVDTYTSEISSFCGLKPGLCQTWLETPKTGFCHDTVHVMYTGHLLYCMIMCNHCVHYYIEIL